MSDEERRLIEQILRELQLSNEVMREVLAVLREMRDSVRWI